MPTDVTTQAGSKPLLRAALVRRTHGVRGEVRVEALGEDPARFRSGVRFVREDTGEVVTVSSVRTLGDGDVLLTFAEAATRELAMGLSGVYLCAERGAERQLGKDEWFVRDLIGLTAVTQAGDRLGVVSDVESYPANDVIVVGTGSTALRFPMVKEFIADVDVTGGSITITPWEEA